MTEDQSRGHGAGKVPILSDQEPRSFVDWRSEKHTEVISLFAK
jgi:hypothetical protein